MTETITMDDSGAVFSLVNEGRAALERRRSDEAVAAFLAALELEPHNAELHNNLGYALSLQSRNQTRGQGLNSKVSERALESFHEALRLRPADRTIIENLAAFLEHVEANNDIIRLLLEQSQHTPWWGDLYFEAGKAMAAERALHSRSAEVPRRIVVDGTALRMWQTALRLGSAKAHVLMAQQALHANQQRGVIKASWLLRRALHVAPQAIEPFVLLGRMLVEQRHTVAAEEVWLDGISTLSDVVGVQQLYTELGSLYRQTRQIQKGIDVLRHAVNMGGHWGLRKEAAFNLGGLYSDVSDLTNALKYLKIAWHEEADNPMYISCTRHFAALNAAWDDDDMPSIDQIVHSIEKRDFTDPEIPPLMYIMALPVPMTTLLHTARSNAYSHIRWAQGTQRPASFGGSNLGWRPHRQRLHVAYLSATFREHVTARFMQGLFEYHDQSKFKVSCVCAHRKKSDSRYRKLIASRCEAMVEISATSDSDAAMLLNNMAVNLLFDIDGFADNGRHGVMVLQPAPLQVAYLGTSASHGAPHLHYIGSDRICVPPELVSFYDEQLWYMPYTFQVNSHRLEERLGHNDNDRERFGLTTRPEAGLPADNIVLTNFNQYHKILRSDFESWLRIVGRLNASVLWVLDPKSKSDARLHATDLAERHGVAERLFFAPEIPMHRNLQRLHLADVYVDTRIYGAVSTASDVLWAGVPLVSTPHEAFVSRAASAILLACGLPELVARDDAEFEDLVPAILTPKVGSTVQKLHNPLRRKLQRHVYTQPHFDTATWVRAWEATIKMAWDLRLQAPLDKVAAKVVRLPHLIAARRFRHCPGAMWCS